MLAPWRLLLLAAAACASSSTEPGASDRELAALEPGIAVDAEDVAILFPLPAPGRASNLWPADHVLDDGRPLLPASVIERLGAVVAGDSNATTYPSLGVVGLRLDPCFLAEGASLDACQRQIRFVLQPIVVDAQGVLPASTLDGAVHVAYALPPRAFVELVEGIVALRPAAAGASALGVHSRLAAEGIDGPFGKALERRVIAAVTQGRLVRVTFSGARGRGNEWQFGGVQLDADGVSSPLPIPPLGVRSQSLVLQRGTQTFAKSLSSPTAGADDVSLLFDSMAASSASAQRVRDALRAANRLENPDLRTSENTDCATCHAVGSSRSWAEKTFGTHEDTDRFPATGVARGAESEPAADLGALRAFGYFGSDVVISTRTTNEIAKALRTLRRDETRRPWRPATHVLPPSFSRSSRSAPRSPPPAAAPRTPTAR